MKLLDTQQSVNNISSDFSVDDMEFDDKTSKEGVDIKPMDVLCGRGKNSFNHGEFQNRFATWLTKEK